MLIFKNFCIFEDDFSGGIRMKIKMFVFFKDGEFFLRRRKLVDDGYDYVTKKKIHKCFLFLEDFVVKILRVFSVLQ